MTFPDLILDTTYPSNSPSLLPHPPSPIQHPTSSILNLAPSNPQTLTYQSSQTLHSRSEPGFYLIITHPTRFVIPYLTPLSIPGTRVFISHISYLIPYLSYVPFQTPLLLSTNQLQYQIDTISSILSIHPTHTPCTYQHHISSLFPSSKSQ